MKHAKTSFSTETFAGATIGVVQYLAPLRYDKQAPGKPLMPPGAMLRSSQEVLCSLQLKLQLNNELTS
jgi:hypothetical protein